MDDLFNGLCLEDFHGDTFRNIVSLRTSEQLNDDLSDNPADWAAADEMEMRSKPSTYVSHQPIIDRPFEEAGFYDAIMFPYEHWCESRYSNGRFGVWYGGDSLETTIHETVHHCRNSLLGDMYRDNKELIVFERKVYLVRCDAGLLDFRKKIKSHRDLVHPTGYHLTHQIGERIHHDGHPGLISRSARCDGDVFAIFNSKVLSSPRNYCYLTYLFNTGDGVVQVERQPGEIILEI